MTSIPHKRVVHFMALVLAVGILLPSGIKLVHALHGHQKEKRCISQGAKHFHNVDFDCEFHDFTLLSKVFWPASITYEPFDITFLYEDSNFNPTYFDSYQKGYLSLRGPPTVS